MDMEIDPRQIVGQLVPLACGAKADWSSVSIHRSMSLRERYHDQNAQIAGYVASIAHPEHVHLIVLLALKGEDRTWTLGEAFATEAAGESVPEAIGILRSGGLLTVGGYLKDTVATRATLLVPGGAQRSEDVSNGAFLISVPAEHPQEFHLLMRDATGRVAEFKREVRTRDEQWTDFGTPVRVTHRAS